MPTSDIRCTSLDGYRLPIGMSIPDKLRAETLESQAFVALITKNLLNSSYCLFELGARWGTARRLFPLYAAGATVRDVNAWLSEYRSASCTETTQMMQFIRELGEHLKFKKIETADSLLRHVEALVNESKRAAADYVRGPGQLDPKDQELKKAEMKRKDGSAAMGKTYSGFWELAHRYYEKYRPKGNPEFPQRLENFIAAAGAPPNTVGTELLAWPVNNDIRLSSDQRRMWNFVQKIYPRRKKGQTGDVWQYSAIKPQRDAKRFHLARRSLGKYWDEWPPIVGWEFISERYQTRHYIILILAWLELALVQWTQMPGSHKQEVFKLARRFAASA